MATQEILKAPKILTVSLVLVTVLSASTTPPSTSSFVVAQPKKDKRSKNRLREDLVECMRDILAQSAELVGVLGSRKTDAIAEHERLLLGLISTIQKRCVERIEQVIDNAPSCKKASRTTLRRECACVRELSDRLAMLTRFARDVSNHRAFASRIDQVKVWYEKTIKTCQVV